LRDNARRFSFFRPSSGEKLRRIFRSRVGASLIESVFFGAERESRALRPWSRIVSQAAHGQAARR